MNTKIPISRLRALVRGFTLIEAMASTAIVGIVASVAYLATSSSVRRSTEVKLRSDVATLNRAVQIYVANGGDVTTAVDSQDVLARLKTQLSEEDASRFVGLTSSMSDIRIKAVYQTQEESQSDQLRAAWDPTVRRFILGNAGDAAIKRFILDEELSEGETQFENRAHTGGFMYAVEDEWIWDFEDRPELIPTQVTTVSIYFRDRGQSSVPPSIDPVEPPNPGPTDPTDPPDPNGPPLLTPPVFSPEDGKFIWVEFPLLITLTEMNPEGAAIIRYAINEGSFQTYSGPFNIGPDDTVRAYCASAKPSLFINSVEVDAYYEAVEQLFAGQAIGGRWTGGHRDGEVPAGGSAHSNNGHGNNEDGVDVSNPGQGQGGPNGQDDPSGDVDDESGNGNGNGNG